MFKGVEPYYQTHWHFLKTEVETFATPCQLKARNDMIHFFKKKLRRPSKPAVLLEPGGYHLTRLQKKWHFHLASPSSEFLDFVNFHLTRTMLKLHQTDQLEISCLLLPLLDASLRALEMSQSLQKWSLTVVLWSCLPLWRHEKSNLYFST